MLLQEYLFETNSRKGGWRGAWQQTCLEKEKEKRRSKPPSKLHMSQEDLFTCSLCEQDLERSQFSKTQWKKGDQRKCTSCVGSGAPNCPSSAQAPSNKPPVVTEISLEARPQKAVPGLEGLTVCTDWPKTKTGQPPGAQSAIFNPLLASVMGRPLAQHCTAEQLQVAEMWWTAALPAWPRWVHELRQAQVLQSPEDQQRLIDSAKGQPNPLIFRAKGRGT